VQVTEQLTTVRAQLREQITAATAAAANLDVMRERCARLEAELAEAHAPAAGGLRNHLSAYNIWSNIGLSGTHFKVLQATGLLATRADCAVVVYTLVLVAGGMQIGQV